MTRPLNGPLVALLVDPSLFTAPYDAALTEGLVSNDVHVSWAIRPYRSGEDKALPEKSIMPIYYRSLKGSVKNTGVLQKGKKGFSHLRGCLRVLQLARSGRFDIVHFQWSVVPLADVWLFRALRRFVPVVLTLHDLSPFNDNPSSKLQVIGFDKVLNAASRIIVHTPLAKEKLIRRGIDAERIRHIPHGPLSLKNQAPLNIPRRKLDLAMWTFVLFGKIQKYKGLDVLIEAVGAMSKEKSQFMRVIVAGEALIELDPFKKRTAELDIQNQIEFRNWHHSESEMAQLFVETDTFVFPYRTIEASGVLFLVQGLGKWIVASDLGAFSNMIADAKTGLLVTPGDPVALADAMISSVNKVPDPSHMNSAMDWNAIGTLTRQLYEEAIIARHAEILSDLPSQSL